ncbi:MAG: Crp/Fnr family transcriptional regulator [Cytophagales bacterium]|nr:Crp/Fnr family transcriptional regulator [Cytophagales bacterium]
MESVSEIFLNSVRYVCPTISEAELSAFSNILHIREFEKKVTIIEAGTVQQEIGLVVQGLVRSSYIDTRGDEITVGFYPEGEYATHYPSFIARKPSRYCIQSLEPTTMVFMSYENIQLMYEKFPSVERYGRLIAEAVLKRQQARIESFIFQSAEERYLDFMHQYPSLFNRVTLSHLCSYLGIERQSLTRIRQKLAHK